MENSNADKKQSGLSWSAPATKSSAPVTPNVSPAKPLEVQKMSSTAKYAGFIAAGIVLGVFVAWGAGAWQSGKSAVVASNSMVKTTNDTSGAPAMDTSTATMAAEGSDPSLLISGPQVPGTSVIIDKAIVSEPTWVVIYEDQNGKPGNALGAALFFPEKQAGTVELLRATVSGKNYLAVKQVDNGDHKFSLKDDIFLSEGGVVQWVTFAVK